MIIDIDSIHQSFNLNSIKNELDKLKTLHQVPRLYLSNFYSDLKTKIDVSFTSKQRIIQNEVTKSKLCENWSLMIQKINCLEKECLYREKTNKLNQNIYHQIQLNIAAIEIELLKSPTDNETLKQLNELISFDINRIERFLFLNKTVIFLNETVCENVNLLYKMDMETTAGKLIIIRDQFLNKKCINLLSR